MNNTTFNSLITNFSNFASPYLNQTKEAVLPYINQAGVLLSPVKNAAEPYLNAAAPYVNSAGQFASRVVNSTKFGSAISTKVSDYVSTHHYSSIYCAAVAVEATTRGVFNLIKIPYTRIKAQPSYSLRINAQFKSAMQHFAFAAAFGVGAINPIAGVVVPALSAFAGNAIKKELSPTSRYISAKFVQKIPETMLALVAKTTSKAVSLIFDTIRKTVTTAISIAKTTIALAKSENVHNIAITTIAGFIAVSLVV